MVEVNELHPRNWCLLSTTSRTKLYTLAHALCRFSVAASWCWCPRAEHPDPGTDSTPPEQTHQEYVDHLEDDGEHFPHEHGMHPAIRSN